MASRMLIFDLESLKDLMAHYSMGEIPFDSEAVGFAVSPFLERYLSLEVSSTQWAVTDELTGAGELVPLNFRYDGRRVFTVQRPSEAGPGAWSEPGAVEAPKLQ
jgi:hypothetical protein